ncbi:MAG TPA: TonB-dependent receptor [Steroidobacteraceae bacterium]|nr:TonB-dependent receptor [Steroidobacteraceae bacterium]
MYRPSRGALLLGFSFAALPAFAQVFADEPEPVIGEIVITAQKRSESLLDAGVSVAVLDAATLVEQRVLQLTDLQGRVPNLDIKEQVPGAIPVVTIRGVGLNDFGAANNPSAGIYIDEVYVASIAMLSFDLYDLERIEVLKGPQGTLYGRNSTAGALNIITKRPQREFDARAGGSYGNYDAFDVEGMINAPLGESVAVRFSAKSIQQGEGFWESRRLAAGGPGERDIGTRDISTARLQVALQPGDAFDANLKIEALRSRSELGQPEFFGTVNPLTGGPCAPILAGHIDNTQCTDFLGYTDIDGDPFRGDWTRDPVYDSNSVATTLTANVALGTATLTSVSGYVDFDRTFDIDVDATPFRQVDFLESDDIRQFSQELRLAGAGDRLDWLVGAFYSEDDVLTTIPGQHQDLLATQTRVDVDQTTESAAAFAHTEWKLAGGLSLIAGARFTSEDRHYAGGTTDLNPFGTSCLLSPICAPGFVGPFQLSAVDTKISDENWSWRIGLEYQPRDTRLLYATVATGVKSGGFFSGISTSNIQLAPFAPEELTAYEIGYKDSLGSVFLDASVFYYDYSDIQTFIAVDIGPFTVQRLGNVPEARVYGADFAAVWQPVSGLTLRGGFGWLDTELGAFATLTGDVPEGNELPNAPELTAHGLVRYEGELTQKLGGLVQVDAGYSDGVFKDAINDPVISSGSYTLVNARLALFGNERNWEVALWSRNLTAEQYVVQGINTGLGGGNRNFNAPRTYGVSLTFNWQ